MELLEIILSESSGILNNGLSSIIIAICIYFLKKKDKQFKEVQNEFEAIKNGLRSVLFKKIQDTAEKSIAERCITTEDLKVIEAIYTSYNKLGGNGIGTKLYEDVLELPIKD